MKNRVKAFTGPGTELKAERVGHFFRALAGREDSKKWCVSHKFSLEKATSESGSNQAGGFLAPIDFDNAIISVRDTVGAFRNCEVRQARSVSQIRPRRVGGLTANFVAEGATIPESSFQLDALEPSLKKLAILVRSSTELYEGPAPNLGEFVASEMGYALAATEDDCGFNGDGTSKYGGISGLGTKLVGTQSAIAAASTHKTFLTIDSTDIANLMSGVLSTAIPGAHWYVSALGFAQTLCRLAAVSGGLTATKNPDGTIDASYLGFPVSFSAKLPNVTTSLAGLPMLFFGNLKMSSVLVERNEAMIIATSLHRAMDADQVLIRATRREDIINHTVGDAANYGAVAMLTGTS